ncbi:hypothetical protein CAEBREN_06216 [Caenorhabditis brenneri]|uniref:C2H2-type domain-containing protein n=1 Tax=Caenorhabditis brenneri TaxID=135651 RepID=G0P885_CAEBE|nr:hypothetical protein CAEBREN_06216 [Caenorhabditis brenneri]
MTTESTIFKVKDGYVLLEDLESWYSNGIITSEDRIQIYENNKRTGGKRMGDYKIEQLIKTYGDQFPFRRIPRPYEHDPLTAYTSDEDDGESDNGSIFRADSPISLGKPSAASDAQTAPPVKTMGGAFGAQKRLDPQDSLPVPRGLSSGSDSYATAPSTVGGAFGARKRVSKDSSESQSDQKSFHDLADLHDDMPNGQAPLIQKKEPGTRFEYRDYPLYNLNNEPEDDRITGAEVVEEMNRLKTYINLRRWSSKEVEYFFFLNRKNYQGYSSVTICRLCNHTPYGGKLFFTHLFDLTHVKKLSERHVSRKSFLFWQNHLESCRGPVAPVSVPVASVASGTGPTAVVAAPKAAATSDTVPAAVTVTPPKAKADFSAINKIFKTIPLFSSGTGTEKTSLEPEEISNLMELFSKISQNSWSGSDNFLSAYFEQTSCSMFCDLCGEEMSHQSYRFTRHILNEKHLKALKGINQREVSFWVNILNLEISAKSMKAEDVMRILTNRNKRPIPLLDFKIEVAPLQRTFRMPKIEELSEMYKTIRKEQFSGSRATLLGASGTLLHQNASCFACNLPKNSFLNQVELVDHMFSDAHVKYLLQFGFSEKAYLWWKKFFEDVSAGTPVTPREQSEQPIPSPPIFNVPQRGKSEEPTSVTKGSSEVVSTKTTKKEFVQSMREMVTSLNDYGKEQAKNKMKFTAPIQELNHWINWALVSSGKPPKLENQKSMTPEKPREVFKKAPKMCHVSQCWIEYQPTHHMSILISVNWICTYCEDTAAPVPFKNMLYAFRHIMSQKHWDNMKNTASVEDLNYWKNWAKGIFFDDVEAPKILPEPKNEKVPEVKAPDVAVPVEKLSNDPRAPMLDQPLENEIAVSKERFNQILDECAKIYWAGGKGMMIAKTYTKNFVCTFCSVPGKRKTQASNEMDAFLHITKGKHREKMGFKASESDLQYWKNWIVRLSEAVKNDNIRLAETVKTDDKKAELPAFESLPLLQKPNVPEPLKMQKAEYQYRYSSIRSGLGWIEFLIKTNFSDKEAKFKCDYCPKTPQFCTVYEAMDHIFKSSHDVHSNYEGTNADFEFYEKIVANFTGKSPNNSTPNDPKPTVQTFEQKRTPYDTIASEQYFCTLPLFRANPTQRIVRYSDTPCTGPTTTQADFVMACTRSVIKYQNQTRTPVKCKQCNIDMSGWSDAYIGCHAFTVTHLDKLLKSGVRVYKEDFSWWITLMNQKQSRPYDFFDRPSIPLTITSFYLGIYQSKDAAMNYYFIFDVFNSEEEKLIKNVDALKLESHAESFSLKYGGCPFCNVWCTTPIEVVNHYTSEAHFRNVRKHRMVARLEVDNIMATVKKCQKEADWVQSYSVSSIIEGLDGTAENLFHLHQRKPFFYCNNVA